MYFHDGKISRNALFKRGLRTYVLRTTPIRQTWLQIKMKCTWQPIEVIPTVETALTLRVSTFNTNDLDLKRFLIISRVISQFTNKCAGDNIMPLLGEETRQTKT